MRLIEGYPALSPLPALRRLLRLEEDLRVARERLARIIRMVPDPAVLKAAEDLCAKAIAALAAYRRKRA
jgi:hypothetical protein